MGKLVIEKWQCDRCGVIRDHKPPRNDRTRYEVRAFVDYGTAGGPVINWSDMCGKCDREVGELLEAMKTPAHALSQEGDQSDD